VVPVADIMRFLMYYESYGDYERAKSLYGKLSPFTRKRLGNIDYSLAESRCPQGISIARAMRKAQKVLI
jgi:hypothetical protein